MDDDDDAFAEHQDLFANKSGAPGLLAKISFDFAGPDFQPSSEDDEVEPAVEPAIEPAIEPEQRDTDDGHEENAEHNSRATSSPLLVEDTVEKEHVVQVVDVDDDSPPPQELASRTRIQIALQDMPVERRNEYAAVYSEVIESIVGGVVDQVERRYMAEFTDGRQKTVRLILSHFPSIRSQLLQLPPIYAIGLSISTIQQLPGKRMMYTNASAI